MLSKLSEVSQADIDAQKAAEKKKKEEAAKKAVLLKKQKEEEKRSGKQIGSAENASDYSGPTNLTEYLFADKYGELSETINATEINQIYLAYMQSLIDSYDRLKSKFNQF